MNILQINDLYSPELLLDDRQTMNIIGGKFAPGNVPDYCQNPVPWSLIVESGYTHPYYRCLIS